MKRIDDTVFCYSPQCITYSLVSRIEISYMQSVMEDIWTNYVFPFFRVQDKKTYIDIYYFEYSQKVSNFALKRFILQEGKGLSEEDEHTFLSLIQPHGKATIDTVCARILSEVITEVFPQWHYYHGMYNDWGKMLEHFYYMSVSTNVRKTLFKAELSRIAFAIERIKHNKEETTPEKIIGLPLGLLKILNKSDDLVELLFSEEKTNLCKKTYQAYVELFLGDLPSIEQWKYLLEVQSGVGPFARRGFQRQIYDVLGPALNDNVLELYKKYFDDYDRVFPGKKSFSKDNPSIEEIRRSLKKTVIKPKKCKLHPPV